MSFDDRVQNSESVDLEGTLTSLMAEREQVSNTVQAPSFQIPEKFQGKSLEDVVKSYVELESHVGKQGQELGELRKVADEFIRREPAPTYGQTGNQDRQDARQTIDWDSLPDDERVRLLVERELSPLKNELNEVKAEKLKSRLDSAHPGYNDIVGDKSFQDWVLQSDIRKEMFARADRNFDFSAADELFTTWKAVKGITNNVSAAESQARDSSFNTARMESGSVDDSTAKPTYSRAAIIALKIKDPRKYAQLSNEIMQAYAEGRVK